MSSREGPTSTRRVVPEGEFVAWHAERAVRHCSNATATTRPSPDWSVPPPPTCDARAARRSSRSASRQCDVASGSSSPSHLESRRPRVLSHNGCSCRCSAMCPDGNPNEAGCSPAWKRCRSSEGEPWLPALPIGVVVVVSVALGATSAPTTASSYRLQLTLRSLGEPPAGHVDNLARFGLRAVQVVSTDEVLCFCIGLLRPRIVVSTGLVKPAGPSRARRGARTRSFSPAPSDPLRLMSPASRSEASSSSRRSQI